VTPGVGVVAIGRNEGERLVRCLRCAARDARAVVYVDSDSSDGSVAAARGLGAEVVPLAVDRPFTAARARNAGFARLREVAPDVELVQFVDGDCELREGWLEAAAAYLAAHPDVAVVCGRRRERHPEASVYNLLADLEWETPVGEAEACGGDALIRAEALEAVGGYDESLIAGEEPELCLRLRRRGHRVVRLDREMTLHDAAMTRAAQWWRRQARAGHAYAEAAWLHGRGPERFRVRELVSILAWGGLLPLALLLAPFTAGLSLALVALLYGTLWLRIRRRRPGKGATAWATACVVGKLAQLQGVATFGWNRLVRRRRTLLMEYKQEPR